MGDYNASFWGPEQNKIEKLRKQSTPSQNGWKVLLISDNADENVQKIIIKGAQHTCALDAVHCQYLGNLLYKMGYVPPIFETL